MKPPSTSDGMNADVLHARKIQKLLTSESSLAELHENLLFSDAASNLSEEPLAHDLLAVRVSVKRSRLALLTAVAVAVAIALLLTFTGGVVITSFERGAVSVQEQEKLVETYNSYSGTVTASIERPLELFMALIIQVIALRVAANDVLSGENRWRTRTVVLAMGAGITFLLANGLSAVNVQARERPVRMVITADDLVARAPDLSTSTTMDKLFAESRRGNAVTNTILRNLLLSQATELRQVCPTTDSLVGIDEVFYRIPSKTWMKDLVPTALEPKSMQFVVSNSNAAGNVAPTTDQFPMNASLAAELLVYSIMDTAPGNAWAATARYTHDKFAALVFRELNQSGNMSYSSDADVPTTRVTGLLPPTLQSTEQEDRDWFRENAAPTMYKLSNTTFRNASLRSWTMTFSHVNIEPGSLWVDAVTIEREMATPRLETNTSNASSRTRYFRHDLTFSNNYARTRAKYIRKAGDAVDERIDLYRVCVDRYDEEKVTTRIANDEISNYNPDSCVNSSASSLLVVSRGKRLVADAVIENATIESAKLVLGKGDGVIVNMREIFSVTVARISWRLQDLSVIYGAQCNATGGCMGLDVALPGSGKRLLVSSSVLPLAAASPIVAAGGENFQTLSLVSVGRPTAYEMRISKGVPDMPEAVGDILLPHNVRNTSEGEPISLDPASEQCIIKTQKRLAAYVNNHVYMESTLQPAYTAAALFLLQAGVPQDILNQSSTSQRMLAFNGNEQGVDVFVFIPRLNAMLTAVGCALLVVAVALVLLWPLLGSGSDPLAHITAPHTIANILLNDKAFPSLLVKRSVADPNNTTDKDNADEFTIASLSLARKNTENDNEDTEV